MPKGKSKKSVQAASSRKPRASATSPPAGERRTPLLSAAKKVGRGPLWEGPGGEGPNGGVTFSLLSRFLTCPERFRLFVVEGLRPHEKFVAPIEFGNMWHVCEESLASEVAHFGEYVGTADLDDQLSNYVKGLLKKFPADRDEIAQWYDKCRALFPLYVKHWSRHPDVENREPLFSEGTFDVWYVLPSGRSVRLRGKRDSVDLVKKGPNCGVWVQENKSKGTIDQQEITRQLTWDLQTMIYVIALVTEMDENSGGFGGQSFRGVRYNVVKRSSHKGGKGKKGQKQTAAESMLQKFREDEAAGLVGEWFARWNVEVKPRDVARFRERCLDPLLERLCKWWGQIRYGADPFGLGDGIHWQHPFGVKNYLDEGGGTDLDECVLTGSTVGLRRVTTPFPEL